MKRGAIREITWDEPEAPAEGLAAAPRAKPAAAAALFELVEVEPSIGVRPGGPRLEPEPADAAEEAIALLRIAAEVEGALLVQYLFTAYSVLPGVQRDIPEIGPPAVSSDRWCNVLREIARQEMGHLITVQNLLLSLNAAPHVDRENFPWLDSGLFPFPFHLERLDLDTLAKAVTAEAPNVVSAGDLQDYAEAAALANSVAGPVSRVGQIYERLYFLFQDGDAAQPPWKEVANPFGGWRTWHVAAAAIGRNQGRQAQTREWWGDGLDGNADTAIYVLPVADLAAARDAIFRIAQQGEGPPDAAAFDTHFDKFLRLYREFRAYQTHPDWPAVVRNQATDPATGTDHGAATITDPATRQWACLANVRYEMLLLYIGLALTVDGAGSVAGTQAQRADLLDWVRKEMTSIIKGLGETLREMPLAAGAAADSPRAGLPFELPGGHDLPATVPGQVAELQRSLIASRAICKTIVDHFNPTSDQQDLLAVVEDVDQKISARIDHPTTRS
jgi:hypothetical protein